MCWEAEGRVVNMVIFRVWVKIRIVGGREEERNKFVIFVEGVGKGVGFRITEKVTFLRFWDIVFD